jgi:hypothetical protein
MTTIVGIGVVICIFVGVMLIALIVNIGDLARRRRQQTACR